MEKNKIYKSKISWGLFFFVSSVCLGPLFFLLFEHHFQWDAVFTLMASLIVYAVLLSFFFNTKYIIHQHTLTIKSGFISYPPIDIDSITEITSTKSIVSAPAVSFDRLKIKYGRANEIILSPKNKQDFVNDLKRLNPQIHISTLS